MSSWELGTGAVSQQQLHEVMRVVNLQAARIDMLEGLVGTEENPVGVAFLGGSPTDVSVNSGDTAWILASSCLVLMMTIPGLALFYGQSPGPSPSQTSTSSLITLCSTSAPTGVAS